MILWYIKWEGGKEDFGEDAEPSLRRYYVSYNLNNEKDHWSEILCEKHSRERYEPVQRCWGSWRGKWELEG